MPPKRKNKATKTPSTTPLKAPPAAIQPSSGTAKRRHSLQGAKTSRLAPSEPLHMTTRRAAKTASNHTSPAAPSTEGSSSRRSSLDDLAHYQDAHSDIEDERPAKRARLSTDSGSLQPSTGSFADQNAVNGTTHTSDSSGRKRRASDQSAHSSRTVSAHQNGVLTRTQSDLSELQPRRKKRKTTQTLAEPVDQPPELTDASTAPNSPEPLAEVDSIQNLHVLPTNGEAPAKTGRRLPGRRRAPHADINVETDLRRQLNLKMSYRSLAKIQKNILEELSSRTTSSLENDPDFYKKCPEYEPLMASLDQHRNSRLDQINAVRDQKLGQLERVREATEHIEKEKYINRFEDLRDDMLLQCYHRMKQIEREMKGEDEGATDDENHVVPPTYVDFPKVGEDDRLGSKFASRSRAYVETERLVDEDIIRKHLGHQLKAFVAANEDADDDIENIPGGFAAFSGPDRAEAIAHHNLMSLADAAIDIEIAPPHPESPKTVPHAQIDALFLLASLSEKLQERLPEEKEHEPQQVAPPAQVTTPVLQTELNRQASPIEPHSIASTAMSLETDMGTPIQAQETQTVAMQSTPRPETNGVQPMRELETPKSQTPARVSTHRIMDILNDDADVPVAKLRESQPPGIEQTATGTPSRRESTSHGHTPSRNGPHGFDANVHRQEPQSDRSAPSVMEDDSLPPMQDSLPSMEDSLPPVDAGPPSPSTTRLWSNRVAKLPSYRSEEHLRRRDPADRVRAMLDMKARDRISGVRERGETVVPSAPIPFSPKSFLEKRREKEDARQSSGAGFNASPSIAPISYTQSPTMPHAYSPARRGSEDQGPPQWARDRRPSGSRAPQQQGPSPYADSSPQPYPANVQNRTGPPPPPQSPYASHDTQQLPPFNQSLPSKPPGPPPNGPVNFRFAHYDPAPPRTAYPQPSPAGYPATSRPPHQGPPPPSQYAPAYGGPSPYQGGGYVPPPGSFQAPPPPPPSTMSVYPPLKIHQYGNQYGGQPILPANMAPPPSHSQPPMSFVAPPPPQPAYSPPQQHPIPQRHPSYDQGYPSNAPQRDAHSERSSEQSRQRRAYRSYHAPGTQFRTYQGPDSSGRRRGS